MASDQRKRRGPAEADHQRQQPKTQGGKRASARDQGPGRSPGQKRAIRAGQGTSRPAETGRGRTQENRNSDLNKRSSMENSQVRNASPGSQGSSAKRGGRPGQRAQARELSEPSKSQPRRRSGQEKLEMAGQNGRSRASAKDFRQPVTNRDRSTGPSDMQEPRSKLQTPRNSRSGARGGANGGKGSSARKPSTLRGKTRQGK
jgi:hypothetical protein